MSRNFARPPARDPVLNLASTCRFKGTNDFQHRIAIAGAEIDGKKTGPALQRVERLEVADGKIDNMDIVAHAGAVTRRVVVAEYR